MAALCAIRPSSYITKILADSDGNIVLLDPDTIPNTLTCQPTGTLDGYAANPFPTSVTATERVSVNRCQYSAYKSWRPIPGFPGSYDITSWELLNLAPVIKSGSLFWQALVKTYRSISGATNYLYWYRATKPFTASDASPKGIYSGWELYSGSDITPAQITLGDLTIT